MHCMICHEDYPAGRHHGCGGTPTPCNGSCFAGTPYSDYSRSSGGVGVNIQIPGSGGTGERRIAELEAENAYVREKIKAYIASKFDPSMMGPTLDDIRHHLKIE